MSDATRAQRTLLFSSSIGTIIEWYDFFVFASAAALVFDQAFFPEFDRTTGLLASLMTYGVGFVTRPLGGILFGILGDRYGRKRALVWSLMLMGVATVGVGLVPSYAAIGVAAPAILVLLRLMQGLAVGGEVGGALLLVTESLSAQRRGYWAAWPMIGGPAGNLVSAGVLGVLGVLMSDGAFREWGWRLGFVASGFLIVVGVWIRTRVEESPLYREYVERRASAEGPSLAATLKSHWRAVATTFFVKLGENTLFYVFTTFFIVYVTRALQLPRGLALGALALGSGIEIVAIFLAGAWSDRAGRRAVTSVGLIGAAVWAFGLFPLVASGSQVAVYAAAAVAGAVHGIIVGGMSPFFVELFPTSARYTGFSLGYQLASVFAGGVAPVIGVALYNKYGTTTPVSLYAAAVVIPGLIALLYAKETKGRDLGTAAVYREKIPVSR